MNQMEVSVLSPNESLEWPEPLAVSGGFIGLDSWMKFVEKAYGFPVYRLAARTDGQVTGLLALTYVRHPIFGKYLATAPFGSYGGFAFLNIEARNALLDQASALAKELDADYVNVRFDAGEMDPPAGWIQHPVYATYRAELSSNPDGLLASYGSDHRNHIRKSLRKGFEIKFGHLELLDDAYEVLARSMRELGSPYHARNYLRRMAESLGGTLEFAVLYDPHGVLAGAGVFIFQGNVATNLHANILRRFRSDYAGEFLYWSVITHCIQKGFRVFDMGRSLIGSGNEVFKLKWRPRKQLLAYWYALGKNAELPELNQKNPKFRTAIWIWKRLPEPVVRLLGPGLIRGLA